MNNFDLVDMDEEFGELVHEVPPKQWGAVFLDWSKMSFKEGITVGKDFYILDIAGW